MQRKKEDKRIKLDLYHAFGSLGYTFLKNQLAIIEETSRLLLYPVGRNLVAKQLDSSEMFFVKLP